VDSRILLYPLGTDHAQKTQPLYCCIAQTTHKTYVTCQTANSLVRYQQWAWRGRRRKQTDLLLRAGPSLQSCCLATRWSNPLQYFSQLYYTVHRLPVILSVANSVTEA
jgi:hypothetical protein